MSDFMRRLLESKSQNRKRLAQLPFAQKLILLQKLRDRSLLITASPLRRRFRPPPG